MVLLRKGMFSKIIITLIIALVIVFTISILYVFIKTSSEPSTLITCFFAFVTGELWTIGTIKKSKIKNEGDKRD